MAEMKFLRKKFLGKEVSHEPPNHYQAKLRRGVGEAQYCFFNIWTLTSGAKKA